jgi:hypothetical protein
MKKLRFTFLKLGVTAAIATGLSVASASAQPVKGTFTLAYEVLWGKAVLPPGQYVVSFDEAGRRALVSNVLTGEHRAVVMAQALDDAMKSQPTALIITKVENQRFVHSFNWREGDQRFIYRPVSKTRGTDLGSVSEAVTVPILMTQR